MTGGGLYPLTQLYQMDEDRTRGDRTLAIMLGGARLSLGVAIASTGAAFACLGDNGPGGAAGVRDGVSWAWA